MNTVYTNDFPLWQHFASSWSGVAHRYRSAVEASTKFSKYNESSFESIYQREHWASGFFFYALSTLECLSFSMRCIASALQPAQFPMMKAGQLNFDIKRFVVDFAATFPGEPLAMKMEACINDPIYEDISNFRNAYAHRGVPPRLIAVGGHAWPYSSVPSNPKDLSTDWKFDEATGPAFTADRMRWITGQVNGLLDAAEQFCHKHVH